MKWEFNGDIVRGGKKIASDLKCDFQDHKFYVKGMLVDAKGNCVPKDIVITNWGFANLAISGISFKFAGIERNTNKQIKLDVSYNVWNHKTHFKGTIGASSIDDHVSTYDEIFAIIAKI